MERPIGVMIDPAFSPEERVAIRWALDAWTRALPKCVRFVDGRDVWIRRAWRSRAIPGITNDTTAGMWNPIAASLWLAPSALGDHPLAWRVVAGHEIGHMYGLFDVEVSGPATLMAFVPDWAASDTGDIPIADSLAVAQLHEACR